MNKEFGAKSRKYITLIKNKNILITNNIKYEQNKTLKTTSKNAFSLLELLVVILILGILAAAVVPRVVGAGDKAKRDLVCVNMKSAANALDMFKLDNGIYPETEEGFEALQTNPDSDKYPNYSSAAYLKDVPKDSWRTKMVYIKTGNTFDIISYGADRREGGTDESADIKFTGCNK